MGNHDSYSDLSILSRFRLGLQLLPITGADSIVSTLPW
jgi:hypothetical protein